MAIEIERKFLVRGDQWRASAGPGERFCQGYVARQDGIKVRVRRAGATAQITVKGPKRGIARPEFEYSIPVEDAEEMLRALCAKPLIEKTRHRAPHAGLTWEIDVFQGPAKGLVLAEVELQFAAQPIVFPDWVGPEVTNNPRYRNDEIAQGRAPSQMPARTIAREALASAPPV